MTNFGLEPFLRTLVELAPHPHPRSSDTGIVDPTDERFTGFVFKIQANMDPRHRDRVAFVRVCSGKFTKDMAVSNSRAGKLIRATRAYRFFGRDRETITEAYAGDIIGLVNPGQFAIGDTVHTGAPLQVPRHPALPAGALRAPAAPGPAPQAVRRWLAAARGRGADAGVLRRERPPRADRRRGRRAAVRRDQEPAARPSTASRSSSIRRRSRPRAGWPIRRSRCRCSAARPRPRRTASSARSCCLPTNGKCSTSRSRTPRSPCSLNRRSPDALRFTRDQKTRRLTFQESLLLS